MSKVRSKKNKNLLPTPVIHILAWSIYIAYELLYLYVISGSISNVDRLTLNYILNISLFYFHASIFLHYTSSRLKLSWLFIIPLAFLEILLFVTIKYLINYLIFGEAVRFSSYEDFRLYTVGNGMRAIYYIGFSTAYWFALEALKGGQRVSELETQRLIQHNEKILLQKDLLQSRNAYLQAQVNPHLLFNTLNFLYNASAKVSDKLADAVMTLSEIMRYALTGIDEDDKVSLEKELDHIRSFIHLNQIRFDDKLNIDFQVKGDYHDLRIIPLALMTLIENVFKYGELQEKDNPAKIRISIEKNLLKMSIFNKKRPNRRIHGHGTGIANLKERLEIYYPDAYKLDIHNTETTYELTLDLKLDQHA